MNKKAQVLSSIIISIMYLMAGILILNLVKDDIPTEKTDLNCANPAAISDGTKLQCLITDIKFLYLFIVIASTGLGFLTERFIKK